MTVRRAARAAAAASALVAGLTALAAHAEPRIANAWMRPAAAGAASADAYADIRTAEPVTLVGVRTSAARAVEIVVADPGNAGTARAVERLALPAGETRFALRGSVLRLLDIRTTLANGSPVVLAFEFVDARGAKSTVETPVQVRGLVVPAAPVPGPAGAGAR